MFGSMMLKATWPRSMSPAQATRRGFSSCPADTHAPAHTHTHTNMGQHTHPQARTWGGREGRTCRMVLLGAETALLANLSAARFMAALASTPATFPARTQTARRQQRGQRGSPDTGSGRVSGAPSHSRPIRARGLVRTDNDEAAEYVADSEQLCKASGQRSAVRAHSAAASGRPTVAEDEPW